MKKRMEQLIDGRYEYDVPALLLSQDAIQGTTKQGIDVEGELHIGTSNNSAVKGMAMSDNRRMLLGKDRFSGNAIHIPYRFDVQGMEPGETCSGSIILSTHIGEYQIPFTVEIQARKIETSAGDLRSLDEFALLASRDYREAFLLYTSGSFSLLFKNEYAKYRVLYAALSENPVTYQHLEEFLIATGKKEPVHLSLEDNGRSFYEVPASTKNTLAIHRSTWGYLRAEIEVTGEFLEVEKRVIQSEDFIGTMYALEYVVHKEKLGHGKKFGRITIKGTYDTLTFDVIASLNSKNHVNFLMVDKKNTLLLARDYLTLLMHKMDYKTWYAQTEALLEEMKASGHFCDIHELYEAYLYYTSDQNDKALAIVKAFSKREFTRDEVELAGFYLYLCKVTGFLNEDEELGVVQRLRSMYEQKESMSLLWVLMQVDEELTYAPIKKLYMMEKQYELGCTSPYLYVEALNMINQDVTLMRKITPFWQQVLLFAGRLRIFSEELAMRVAYLSGYEKNFHEEIFHILEKVYSQFPKDDILEAICRMLLRGDPENKAYFPWYERAVERDIRVTRLYEYYVETMEEDYQRMLPQSIRLYFAYSNTLSDKKKAYIYANIITNKEQDRQTFDIYRDTMEEFAYQKLSEGSFNHNYSILYREFIQVVRERPVGEALAKVLFMYKLTLKDSKITSVIVHHGPFVRETVYPCENGAAYIALYSKDAKIVFQDAHNCRYYDTVEYSLEKLMDNRDLIEQCLGVDVRNPGFLLYVCQDEPSADDITITNICAYQHVLISPQFRERYKEEIRQRLLEYYAGHAEDDTLDDYLHEIDYDTFARRNKQLLVEVLVERGWYEDAMEIITHFGYEHIGMPALLKLCSRIIQVRDFREDEEILYLAEHVFKEGKYDDAILTYLIRYHMSCVDDMYRIWDDARRFEMDTYELEERLLIYSMYVRKYPPEDGRVLKHYVEQGGREQVIQAYLSFVSYGYFFENRAEDETIVHYLEVFCENRQLRANQISRLALLAHYIKNPELIEGHKDAIEEMMARFSEEHLRLSMFQRLPKEFLMPFQMDDRIFLEQKACPRDKVTLFYSINSGQVENMEFLQEPVKDMFQGIFSKEFVLFYGENLTYYFSVEHEGEVTQTERRQVAMREVAMRGHTKYQLLNQMLSARRLGQEQQFAHLMARYLFLEQLSKSRFTIME